MRDLTDNRNRTAAEVRKIFEIAGGKLGATGCVAWMFDRKGLVADRPSKIDEDALMELALEAGADDVRDDGDSYEVIADPTPSPACARRSKRRASRPRARRSRAFPKDTVDLDGDDARRVLKLMEALDDHDDVQNVSANFNIPDEAMAELGSRM